MGRKVFIAALGVMAIYVAAWLITGFISWDLDPSRWDVTARMISATLATFLAALVVAAVLEVQP